MKGWKRTVAGQNRSFIDRRNAELAAQRAMDAPVDLNSYHTVQHHARTRMATAYLTVNETAHVLGVKPETVCRYMRSWQLHGRGKGKGAQVAVISVKARIRSGKAAHGDVKRLEAILAARVQLLAA
jgi:hypothetical protein